VYISDFANQTVRFQVNSAGFKCRDRTLDCVLWADVVFLVHLIPELREEGDVFVADDGAFGQFQPEDRLSLAVFGELKSMVAVSWRVVFALVLYHGYSCNPDPPLFPDGVDWVRVVHLEQPVGEFLLRDDRMGKVGIQRRNLGVIDKIGVGEEVFDMDPLAVFTALMLPMAEEIDVEVLEFIEIGSR
jgi:hypothetical protein